MTLEELSQLVRRHNHDGIETEEISTDISSSNGLVARTAENTYTGRTITGTSNQISVANSDGVSGNPTLSTPQNIHTAATPQFARLGLSQVADSSAVMAATGQYFSTEYDAGNSSTALTIDWNNGNVQHVSMTGNCTFTFNNPKGGGRYILILEQDGTGSRTATWPVAVIWPASTAPALTTTASRADIVTFVYSDADGKYYGGFNLNYAP